MMHAAHVPNGSTRTNGPCRCTSVAVHVRCKDGVSGGRPDGQRAARVLGQPADAIIQKQLVGRAGVAHKNVHVCARRGASTNASKSTVGDGELREE